MALVPDLTPQRLSALIKRDSVRCELDVDIARALGVHLAWLNSGALPKLSPSPDTNGGDSPAKSQPIEPGDDYVAVQRVLFKLSAGVTGYQVEPLQGNGPPIFFRRDFFERNHYQPEKLLAVRISGQSMEPGLFDGDLIVLNSADSAPADGEVFAANYEGELVIKRLKRDSGEWWLASDNQDKRRYPDKRCDEHVTLIGRVIYKQSERI